IDRQRPDRAHHVDLMAEPVHMLELLVEVEPLGPAVEDVIAALLAQIGVAAAVVALRARKAFALAQPLRDRARPPVEMRIDDVHGAVPNGAGGGFAPILPSRPHAEEGAQRPSRSMSGVALILRDAPCGRSSG